MIFVVSSVVAEMHSLYDGSVENFKFPELEKKAIEAAAIMEEMLRPSKENVESLTVLLQQDRDAKTQASTALEQFDQHSVAVANASNASRARRTNKGRQNYRAMSNPDSRPNANEVAQNNEQQVLVDALTDHNAAGSALASARDSKLVSKDDFLAHTKETTTPIFEDYKRLFLDANGPFKKLTDAFNAARVLNPLVAKDTYQATMKHLWRN